MNFKGGENELSKRFTCSTKFKPVAYSEAQQHEQQQHDTEILASSEATAVKAAEFAINLLTFMVLVVYW